MGLSMAKVKERTNHYYREEAAARRKANAWENLLHRMQREKYGEQAPVAPCND